MRYYDINNYFFKTIKKTKTIINLKKNKKPFLFILNNLILKLRTKNIINGKNSIKYKIVCIRPIFLPFHIKQAYFKKIIRY